MKKIILLILFCSLIQAISAQPVVSSQGAWGKEENGVKTMVLITDRLISVAIYNEIEKRFLYSWGGTYVLHGRQLQLQYEWHSKDSTLVHSTDFYSLNLETNKLNLGESLKGLIRLGGNSTGELHGTWIISGTYADSVLKKRPNPFFPRRTMKIIAGDYFQWVSYNVETKKFFDAGGGKQSHVRGQYTEEIEYFTKTSASVGKKLFYTYSISGDDWRHSGQKSTGGILDECWTRRSRIESQFLPKAN